MGIKRQKQVRKSLAFYKQNFGYSPPYYILVDGTFCRAALKQKINIREQLPKYLEAEINICTTQCTLDECEAFGNISLKSVDFRCIHSNATLINTGAIL